MMNFSSETIIVLLLLMYINYLTAQSPPNNSSNFMCSEESESSCETYVSYFVQDPVSDLGNISKLFGVNRSSIAKASNLESEDPPLLPHQLLLVPITCGCTGNHYFANISYQIKEGDNYYFVSTTLFENLTNWQAVLSSNPSLNPTRLKMGDTVIFPLFCKCPSAENSKNGINNLITYIWQPLDDLLQVSATFKTSALLIIDENNYDNLNSAVGFPVLIPVSKLPVLFHSYPPNERTNLKRRWVLIGGISLVGASIFLLVAIILVWKCCSYRKTKCFTWKNCQIRSPKGDDFESKIIHGRLLSGVDDCLSKPVLYDTQVIMDATMNFSESCKIEGSVYKAAIDGEILAVKKTQKDMTEELKILRRINHVNIVKLMGTSSDKEGNFFLVYEYAENGSLDNWLHSSDSTIFISWSQRLAIALDVANGLQYLHGHTQPSIAHRDIRASNIVLDSKFKAKIANMSMARPVTSNLVPKVDVFAFGVIILELLSGKNGTETKGNGEVAMLWKEIREVIRVEEEREERLRRWLDPKLEGVYPINGALCLAAMAIACTEDNVFARPNMAEILFTLSLLFHSPYETVQGSGFSSSSCWNSEETDIK